MVADAPAFLATLAATPSSASHDALTAWGRQLGRTLASPIVITCSGDLGAGKTTLVRALCEGLGVRDLAAVTSPTFAVVHEYRTHDDGRVVHVDLYRVRRVSELDTLGWDEIVATAPVLIVEWPEIAERSLPSHRLQLSLQMDDASDSSRRVRAQWRENTYGWQGEVA